MESDPIGLNGGLNTYAYVDLDPLGNADSSGLFIDEGGQFLGRAALGLGGRAAAAAALGSVASAGLAGAAVGSWIYGRYSTEILDLVCEKDKEDKCRKILSEIYKYLKQTNNRIDEMEVDKFNLFEIAHDEPHYSLPKGSGSWRGHAEAARGWQRGLRYWIQEAINNGCKVPRAAWKAAYRDIPQRPRR